MHLLLKYLFATLIILNITNLFVFTSTWLNLSLTLIGGLIIVANSIYLFTYRDMVFSILRKPAVQVALVLFLIWPVLWVGLSFFKGYTLYREIVLQFYYAFLFLGTIVFILREGWQYFRKIIIIAFGISIFGMVLDMFFPAVFAAIAASAAEDGLQTMFGRANGFFLNPNNAGRFLILMYVLCVMKYGKISKPFFLGISFVLPVMLLFTGSRSSLLIGAIVIALVVFLRLSGKQGRFITEFNAARIFMATLVLGLFCTVSIFGVALGSNWILNNTEVGMRQNASLRYEMFTGGSGQFFQAVRNEIEGRFYTLEPYNERLKDSFILGNGTAGMRIYRAINNISLTPHNTLYLLLFDYGILYLISFVVAMLALCFSRKMRRAEKYMGFMFSFVFLVAFTLIFFTFEAMLTIRGTYVVIGAIIALRIADEQFFQKDIQGQHLEQRRQGRPRLRA